MGHITTGNIARTDKSCRTCRWSGNNSQDAFGPFTEYSHSDNTGWVKRNVVEYEIIQTFSALDLAAKKPCSDEYTRFINELGEDDVSLQHLFTHWKDLSKYESVMNNVDWLIDEGFIKEKEKVVEVEGKKEFEPFDITFRVECKKDLMSMLDALGSAPSDISDNSIHDCYEYWDLVDDKVSELGLKMG